MKKKHWIFPAISCIPLSMMIVADSFLIGIVLYTFWIVRIICLNNKEILMRTVIINLLFCCALVFHQLNNNTVLNKKDSKFIVFPEATSIKVDGDSLRFEGVVMTENHTEKVIVKHRLKTEIEKERWSSLSLTNHLVIEGVLEEPSRNSNFNQFNYRDYLKRNNIHWQLQANDIQSAKNLSLTKPSFYQVENLRAHIFNSIDRTFNSKNASYLKILFFADKRDVSEEILQSYRSMGIVHLFSISGFHITYLVNLIRRLFLRLGVTQERTNLILLVVLPIYGVLAGLGVSVFRAVFHSFVILIGRIRKSTINTLDAWSITMLAALFLNPYQIFDLSFQLSYLLSGIFIMIGRQSWLRELNVVIQAFMFAFMSALASLPILAYYFFEVSWITIFANLLFVPFFTYVLFPALLLLLCLAPFLARAFLFSFLNEALAVLITTIENGLAFLNNIFNFSFVIGRLPFLITLLLIWSIFQIFTSIEKKKIPSFFSIGLLLFSLFYYQISPVGYVLMLDVGQGDSILIKEPITGKITMIDTGGQVKWYTKEPWQEQETPFSIGKNVTTPVLKSLGISSIDRLYVTHADADHFGEIESLEESISIKEIMATRATFKDEMVLKQIQTLKNTKLREAEPPIIVDYPTKNTVILHPMNEGKSNNDDSLTLYVKIGKDTWLFSGDIEGEAEGQIINRYPNLKATHLKVAHHGSKTSTSQAFLEHTQPKQAFISVGRNNTYGHPNEEVMNRLEEMDIHIFSTVEDGAIMIQYFKCPFLNDWFTKTHTVYKN